MYEVGSIIIVYNQVFKDGKIRRIDHVKKRPVLVVCENNDYIYYVTLTSKNFPLNVKITANNKEQYAKIRDIYKKPIFGYVELERIDDKDLLRVLKGLYHYQVKNPTEEFKEIEKMLLIEIEKTLKRISKEDNKKR